MLSWHLSERKYTDLEDNIKFDILLIERIYKLLIDDKE